MGTGNDWPKVMTITAITIQRYKYIYTISHSIHLYFCVRKRTIQLITFPNTACILLLSDSCFSFTISVVLCVSVYAHGDSMTSINQHLQIADLGGGGGGGGGGVRGWSLAIWG